MRFDPARPHSWSLPIPILYGPGRRQELASICVQKEIKAPLIVTDRGSSKLSFISEIESLLIEAGIKPTLYCDISPNPIDHEILAGRESYRQAGCDAVIAIGGGSGLDGGKAIALIAHNAGDLWQFEFEQPSPKLPASHHFPPLICVPTTAGTGAETESTAMVTHTGKRMKFCLWHPACKPAVALLDPELTYGLPANLTAWTGVDAITHAIEAYCVPGYDPVCDAMALEALNLLTGSIREAVANGADPAARGNMQLGACLAGVSFVKGLGLVHSISHMIGALHDTHHGLTNAILLPSVLRFNRAVIEDKAPDLAAAMGCAKPDFDHMYNDLCTLLNDLSIPTTLAEIGVRRQDVAEIAVRAMLDSATGTNPRKPTQLELESIIVEAIDVGR